MVSTGLQVDNSSYVEIEMTGRPMHNGKTSTGILNILQYLRNRIFISILDDFFRDKFDYYITLQPRTMPS